MPLSILTEVAAVEVQLSVTVSPAMTVALSEEIETVGIGGCCGFWGVEVVIPPPPHPINKRLQTSRARCEVRTSLEQ
jgi:hypothetical protein